jgi:hypothetical protein
MTRRRLLTDDQADELRRRYKLHRDNTRQKLIAEFGIGEKAFEWYIYKRHKDSPDSLFDMVAGAVKPRSSA